MKSRLKNIRRKGFSLIEVLIAIAILGVGLVMVATIFPVAATWTRQAAEETVASQVALNAVNIIKVKLNNNAFSWQSDIYYPQDSLVVYDGVIYKANAQNFGVANKPPAGNWDVMDGSSATKIATLCDANAPFSDSWNSGKTYTVGDKVFSGGNIYTSLVAGNLNHPVTDVSFWSAPVAAPSGGGPLFPVFERAYAFGSDSPYPASSIAAANAATYFWTAILRPMGSGQGATVNVYVCVFRKGASEQAWAAPSVFVSGSRASGDDTRVPPLVYATWNKGTRTGNTITGSIPPVGAYGIAVGPGNAVNPGSGAVFRQGLTADADVGCPTVFLQGQTSNADATGVSTISEKVIYAPAPDNSDPNASPLVYIYQTKLSF